jgi:hypothetical protein
MNIPNTNQPGLLLTSVGDGLNTVQWSSGSAPTVNRTYSVSGPIAVPSSGTNFLPPFHYVILMGETVTFKGVYCELRTGSATIDIEQNGSAIAGLSSLSVTTTGTYTAASGTVSVASLDSFAPVVTAVSSTPDGMEITFVFTVTM